MHGNMEANLFYKELNFVRVKAALFHRQGEQKWGLPHFDKHEKKPLGAIYDLYKMKQSHWLLCVGKEL